DLAGLAEQSHDLVVDGIGRRDFFRLWRSRSLTTCMEGHHIFSGPDLCWLVHVRYFLTPEQGPHVPILIKPEIIRLQFGYPTLFCGGKIALNKPFGSMDRASTPVIVSDPEDDTVSTIGATAGFLLTDAFVLHRFFISFGRIGCGQ